ncbi:gag-asp_proteas domain-containing protein [Cephalotus follicularis]|uniref:Gag-asp_proteas domain-containing protein n=1 Tax=Cephalotus follicularis TaxID=3775 RepID=A0A1Q3B6X7_CEPFO|nr:gag-asp_proteas domain-containing protein [Cephalotus follicularis]
MKSYRNPLPIPWLDYVNAISCRFGDLAYEDPLVDLKNLSQTSYVVDYMDAFDTFLNKTELSNENAISLFLGGLRPEIQLPLRLFNPQTLQIAYSMAKLQESICTNATTTNRMASKPSWTSPQKPTYSPPFKSIINTAYSTPNNPQFNSSIFPLPHPSTKLPINNTKTPFKNTKPLPSKYMEERRMKNLCFWCDEKFIQGQKCKNRQVYMMEVEGITGEEGYEDCTSEDTALQPQVSLHALTGSIGQDTMQVVAVVGRKHLQVLIDSGSTHNFLTDDIVQKLGLPLVDIPMVSVRIANGEQLHYSKMCKDFQWKVQGYLFEANVFIIHLENYDLGSVCLEENIFLIFLCLVTLRK